MSEYNLNNMISKFVNYQALQNKVNVNVQNSNTQSNTPVQQSQTPQTSAQPSTTTVNAYTQTVQVGNLSGGDTSVYIKDLMKLPKNLNEFIYIIQRNLTQAQFNQQFMSTLNKNMMTPTQAQILAQLQGLSTAELQNTLNSMNTQMLAQLQANLKNLPINANGMINLSEISALIQTNGKDALANLIATIANASKMGVQDISQLKETAKLINASIATASQNDNAQTMKLLLLLYLPWLPLQEGTGFDLEIKAGEKKEEADSILTITINTINYGTIVATLILESSNSVMVNISCSENFPKNELILRIEKEEKHYSLQSVLSFDTPKNDKTISTNKQEAKINMSNTNQINPYLLLMAHTVIRHTLEIDKNKSDGITSHLD